MGMGMFVNGDLHTIWQTLLLNIRNNSLSANFSFPEGGAMVVGESAAKCSSKG